MGYFRELTTNWRPLLAAVIGLGSGFSFTTFMTSIMAPHLIAEFGWSRADFATLNSLSLVMVAAFPVVGRLTDVIGVRRTALIGVVTLPITFVGLSMMQGDIRSYIFIFLVQALLCITTTATVYSRVVVQYIEKARGLALAIVASGPAFSGAIGGPLFNNFVEVNGWREGYIALAIFSATAGALALLMMPPERKSVDLAAKTQVRHAKRDYSEIIRNRAFWIMLAALLLCNLPQVIVLSQINLVLLENGIATADASIMISAFSIGMLLGRFACGVALDRFPAHIVATIAMFGPSIGLAFIASPWDAAVILTLSFFIIGLAFGAEGDLVGYLVARNFGVRVYSSVMGLMTAAISTSSALGAAFLGLTLAMTGSFALFLIVCSIAVLVGSLLFLLLRGRVTEEETASAHP